MHPFYSDLMNVLYDRDHYKLALGQANAAKHHIANIAKDYLRLLKFGDSLYRCKQLKRACLGRMCTLIKGMQKPLEYLEEVRQHLGRLPSIDPSTRTLLVTGYPNVGKSSFMNKLTRAQVEVQPYAFTTKSLFVGHMDYRYLRWQVIDTPGILDHPLEERNTIEMQSITALAHLRACILYFMDLSEQCGYSIAAQVSLFHSIKPLFANKPLILVINKVDVMRFDQLTEEQKALVNSVLDDGVELMQTSCFTDEGVMDVRQLACDKLLAMRVEQKLRTRKAEDITAKLHVSQPTPRDGKERPPVVQERVVYDHNDPMRRKLERDIERENGGAGVYIKDWKKSYMLRDDEWKYDAIPEIWDGKNIADFFDADIVAKLDALEREEEALEAAGYYDKEEEEEETEETLDRKKLAKTIRDKKLLMLNRHRSVKVLHKNRPVAQRSRQILSTSDFKESMKSMGLDAGEAADQAVARSRSSTRKRARSVSRGPEDVEEGADDKKRARSKSVAGVRDRSASASGLRDEVQQSEVERIIRKAQRERNLRGRAGEADRHIGTAMPRHLFQGKRKNGTHDRR